MRTAFLFLAIFCAHCAAAEWTWTGLVSGDWNIEENWTSTPADTFPPNSDDTVVLAGGTFNPANQNIPNLTIQKLVIPASIQAGTVVSGNSITLGSGGLEFQAAASDFTFAVPIVLDAPQRWQIANGRTLFVTGAISATFADLSVTGTASTGTNTVTSISDPTAIVAGLAIVGENIADTWIVEVNGTTLTLPRLGLLSATRPLTVRQAWRVQGGTLDLSAADGTNLNASVLVNSGTLRFAPLTKLKGGATLDTNATLELKAGSGTYAFPKPIVSLDALSGGQTKTNSPAILVHSGDTLTIPFSPGTSLIDGVPDNGGGTANTFRFPGAGKVSFSPAAQPVLYSTASLRLENGEAQVAHLPLQPASGGTSDSGVIEFHSDATLSVTANSTIAQTAADGSVTPDGTISSNFVTRYGPRQIVALGGIATVNIASGALFQNNQQPVSDYILAASGATLRIAGADDTAVFRLGRGLGAISTTLNTGRFDMRGGQFYIFGGPTSTPYRIFPAQAGFTLALNGGIFNGDRCDDFLGHFRVHDASAGAPRIDNFTLGGSGDTFWGAGVLEKINVVDSANGHSSAKGLHSLMFNRGGGTVAVQNGATLRISSGSVIADGVDIFRDSTVLTRSVSIENNATLEVLGSSKFIGALSGTASSAVVTISGVTLTSQSESDTTYAGRFSGSGVFNKAGAGVLRLSGNNSTFTGTMNANGGVLVAENTVSATGPNTVTVGVNGTLSGAGKITGAVLVNGELAPGRVPYSSGDNALETGALTLAASSTLRCTLGATPAVSDTVSIGGGLTVQGGSVRVENGGGVVAGDYPLLTYSGTFSGDAALLTLVEAPAGFDGSIIHDTGNKTILVRLARPPVSTIATPTASVFRTATWPGSFSGTATDPNALGLAQVEISVRKDAGNYFDGTAFTSATEVWLSATVNSQSWNLTFPTANFATDGAYTVRVRARDAGNNTENPPAQRAFSIDRVAPTVSVNSVSTSSASPALSGSINDASATIQVTVNGSTVAAQNNGATWSLAAGTLPGMSAGVYDVIVQATDPAGNVGADGSSAELTIALPAITVNGSSPASGSAAGGTLVTLSGSNLDLVTAVKFAGTAGTLQSKSPTSVTVLTPAHDAGTFAITIESLSNTVMLSAAFTFINPPPTITSITPARVSTAGGSQFTVNGSGFLNGANVQVDGVSASDIVRVSSNQLTARAPAHAPGNVAVTVVNPDNNAVSLPNALTYDQPPQATSTPKLNASQVPANTPVQLLFDYRDPEGGPVSISIDWGDGSQPGASSTHTYANEGTYTITISVSDGIGTTVQTLSVVIGGSGGTPGPGTPTPTLQVDALSVTVRFDKTGKDAFSIKGVFPALPAGTNFEGMAVLDVGGVRDEFLLNEKGKGKSLRGSLTLRLKFVRNKTTRVKSFAGGSVTFTAKVKGALNDAWKDEGLQPETTEAAVPFLINLTMAGSSAQATVTTLGKVKRAKTGTFRFKQ